MVLRSAGGPSSRGVRGPYIDASLEIPANQGVAIPVAASSVGIVSPGGMRLAEPFAPNRVGITGGGFTYVHKNRPCSRFPSLAAGPVNHGQSMSKPIAPPLDPVPGAYPEFLARRFYRVMYELAFSALSSGAAVNTRAGVSLSLGQGWALQNGSGLAVVNHPGGPRFTSRRVTGGIFQTDILAEWQGAIDDWNRVEFRIEGARSPARYAVLTVLVNNVIIFSRDWNNPIGIGLPVYADQLNAASFNAGWGNASNGETPEMYLAGLRFIVSDSITAE